MGKMSFDRCTRILKFIRENIKPLVESDVETQDEALERATEIIYEYQQLQADYENRLKTDLVAMLNELQYDLYHELCKEIHGKEDCPCTNQTTSCLATFRVCDADRAIGRTIQQKIDSLKGE